MPLIPKQQPPYSFPKTAITLTNSQILTLRTTEQRIIPAPGANKIIIPTFAAFIIQMRTGAYGNITDSSLQLGYETFTEILTPPITTSTTLGSASTINSLGIFTLPNLQQGAGTFASTNISDILEDITNKAIVIKDDWSGGGNYTGGNPDNQIKIYINYITITL